MTLVKKERKQGNSMSACLWLIIIIGGGAAVRLIALSSHSLLIDEAFVAVGARDIAFNHTPMWEAASNAPVIWLYAEWLKLFGTDNSFLLRLPSVITGVLSIGAVYLLSLHFLSRTQSLIASALYALHPIAIAFSRVAFVDTHQVLMITLGYLAIEEALNDEYNGDVRWRYLLTALIWAVAFILKYNAIVYAFFWIAAGVISGRYKLPNSIRLFFAISILSFLTLLFWPYDAPIWLLAFVSHGASYDFHTAILFFWDAYDQLFFGAIVLVVPILVWLLVQKTRSTGIQHLSIFVTAMLIFSVLFGRMFLRYVLPVTPIVVLVLVYMSTDGFRSIGLLLNKRWPYLKIALPVLFAAVMLYGYSFEVRDYLFYLHNDTSQSKLTSAVERLAQNGTHRVYWLESPYVGAYYLGFRQHYSRSTRPGLHHVTSELNYFDGSSVSYWDDTLGYRLREDRNLTVHWGYLRAITHWKDFQLEIARIGDSIRRIRSRITQINYLTDSSVHSGDILVIPTGRRDANGEPYVRAIDTTIYPGHITQLPLNNFSVLRAFRPWGETPLTNTTVYSTLAGDWILQKK